MARFKGLRSGRYTGRRGGLQLFDRSNEPVTAAGQGLDKARAVRGVAQHFPEPHHGVVQSVIEIDKSVAWPKALTQFVAGNDFARLFEKDGQNLKRLFGKLEAQTMLAQFEGFKVKIEGAAADYFRRMDGFVHIFHFGRSTEYSAAIPAGQRNLGIWAAKSLIFSVE